MKFSLVIPVYNVENYIVKCLDSILHQSYSNYEVIIVNDGSPDQSEKIIRDYIKDKKNFKLFSKENGGLSDARNFGVKKATGDYLLFVDSDDYIEKDLLQNLNHLLEKNKYDVVRYELQLVDEYGKVLQVPTPLKVDGQTKEDMIQSILKSTYIEPAWLYAYRTDFWKANHFAYPKGRIHEDYGLTPIVLDKAESIGYIPYVGYHYVQRANSIMNQVEYDKIKKRVNDFKEQFLHHRECIKPTSLSSKLLLSFSAEALIYKAKELKREDQKSFAKFLRKEKVIQQIYPSNLKKVLVKIYLYLFLEHRIKKLSTEFYSQI